jgi:hypothetical protein
MPIISKIIFGVVRWASRNGLREEREVVGGEDSDSGEFEDAEELRDFNHVLGLRMRCGWRRGRRGFAGRRMPIGI